MSIIISIVCLVTLICTRKTLKTNKKHRYLVISLFVLGTLLNMVLAKPIPQEKIEDVSIKTNQGTSKKVYSDIVDEYKDAIKNDSDYTSLIKLADDHPENIRFYAKAYCEAKAKGVNDDEIKQYLDEQAEKISKSFSDSDTAKILLRKTQNYSIELGKKYYCS